MGNNRSRSKTRAPQRRGGRQQREQKKAVLLLVEGEVTEKQYFEKLKVIRGWSKNTSVTVQTYGKTPQLMAEKAEQSLTSDEYDYVFLVFDKDELSERQIEDAVSLTHTSDLVGKLHVCVSAPKFEIWLCAHYQIMKQACDDKKVTDVESKIGILQPSPKGKQRHRRKHMPSAFPYDEYENAKKNTNVSELGSWDEQGSTSIPKLIEFIDDLNK